MHSAFGTRHTVGHSEILQQPKFMYTLYVTNPFVMKYFKQKQNYKTKTEKRIKEKREENSLLTFDGTKQTIPVYSIQYTVSQLLNAYSINFK